MMNKKIISVVLALALILTILSVAFAHVGDPPVPPPKGTCTICSAETRPILASKFYRYDYDGDCWILPPPDGCTIHAHYYMYDYRCVGCGNVSRPLDMKYIWHLICTADQWYVLWP